MKFSYSEQACLLSVQCSFQAPVTTSLEEVGGSHQALHVALGDADGAGVGKL